MLNYAKFLPNCRNVLEYIWWQSGCGRLPLLRRFHPRRWPRSFLIDRCFGWGGGNNPIDVDEDTDDDSIGGKKAGGETNAGKRKEIIIEVRRDAARSGGVFRYFNWIVKCDVRFNLTPSLLAPPYPSLSLPSGLQFGRRLD